MTNSIRWFGFVAGLVLLISVLIGPLRALAADHRDSPVVDGISEGDITDFFAFLDPNSPASSRNVVLIMNVNPFALPAVRGSYRFGTDLLYQFKIDTTGDAVEDLVVQVLFTDNPDTSQSVQLFGPAAPADLGATNRVIGSDATLSGPVNRVNTDATGTIKLFAGLRDDPFVFDFGQFFRILNGSQDFFRAVPPFLGRPVRSDGTSGVDGAGGFNVSSIQVEFPASLLNSQTNPPIVNIWGTVSQAIKSADGQGNSAQRVARRGDDKDNPVPSLKYKQFERNGQQVINTVFIPATLKDQFNADIPANDVKTYGAFVPDALTIGDNDGTGNTIAGRAKLLHALGVDALPNGAPLLLDPTKFVNGDPNLLREAVFPDTLRLNLAIAPTGDLNELAIGQFALQNGRRVGDDVIDIALRLLRQLADVKFPPGSGLPGSGPATKRSALDCTNLNLSATPVVTCKDRRVMVVLQGTDFIKSDAQVPDVTFSGNDRILSTTFPFLATPHPFPGDAGTVGFPPQQ